MSGRSAWALSAIATGGILAALPRLPAWGIDLTVTLYLPAVALVAVVSGAFLMWHVHPAYTLSAAIFLTPFAGNWPELGVPGPLSPDRLLFVGAIVSVLLRSPPVAFRPPLRISGAHCLLALALIYALLSAFVAGTLLDRGGFLLILDTFGILPFLTFLVAPVAFSTAAHRRVLLGTLVALGAYVGLTVLFDMAQLDALVFPRYILDPNAGLHPGRGRGPFVDPVACGLALYTCAVACGIAIASWKTRSMRAVAVGVGLLCAVGAFLSLERSVWIGAVAGTATAMLAIRGLRRYFVAVVVAVAVTIVATLTLIPGLSERVADRANDRGTLWDRRNLDRAGLNMVKARPLTGFGWGGFLEYGEDFFEQSPDYPLTASKGIGLHNTPLTYAVELGLIGLTLWLLGLLFGVGSALAARGPPDLLSWRVGLLAVAVATLVVLNAVPPTAWPNRALWLLAGAAYAGHYVLPGPGGSLTHGKASA
jgi:putative inorganic carbon (HCO3(-)) transporter